MLRGSGTSFSKTETVDGRAVFRREDRTSVYVRFFVMFTAAWMLFSSAAYAAPPQKPADPRNNTSETTVRPGQIGDSGYVVPIPEIKMRSIIGNKPSGPPRVEETEAPQSVPPGHEEQSRPADAQEPAVHEPTPRPKPPVEVKHGNQDPARLPFDPAARTPQESPLRGSGLESGSYGEDAPPFRSPQAPELASEAPHPKKEILKRKTSTTTAPSLLENHPVKETAKPVPLESLQMGTSTDSGESITLDDRRRPEMESESSRESATRAESAATQSPKESVPDRASVPGPPSLQPEPQPTEAVPMKPPSEIQEEAVVPKETVPTIEQPSPGPKESFPSPLGEDTLNSREAKEYLRQAAPILEELSLLMTRAPSLNIADFDPSDPAAALVPKELLLKMDSMKRELQILDSKTFSIIPPPKYSKFHSVVRESITSTYQACDAIIAYIKDSTPENLQKVLTSLVRSRELIRRTRSTES